MKTTFSLDYMIDCFRQPDDQEIIDLLFRESDKDITIDDIIDSEIPLEVKFWFVILKSELLDIDKIRIAIEAAKIVLPIYETDNPNDNRPRKAIEASEKYLNEGVSKSDLNNASAAADAAASAVAYVAFGAYAAAAASYSYASYAAASAARTARAAYDVSLADSAARVAITSAFFSDTHNNTTYTSHLLDCLKSFIKTKQNGPTTNN